VIAFVVAMDRMRAIGRNGALPWHLPSDLRRFKALTVGKTVLMGRKTFESIGRLLPQRRNVVLTRDPTFGIEGLEVIHTLEEALALDNEIMVIGGGEIYKLLLPFATLLHLTLVDTVIETADTFFPQLDINNWCEVLREFHPSDHLHSLSFSYIDLRRIVTGQFST